MAKKPRADSKLKNLPDADQETFWRMLHPDDPEVKPSTLADLAAFIRERYDFDTLSLSTLSEWHSWYALRQRTLNAQKRADQARLEWLKENPDADPADLEKLGQMVFTAEAIEGGNVKAYVALAKLRLQERTIEHDERRIRLLEEKARRADEAAVQMRKLKEGGKMLPDQERQAILDKVDELLGLKG